jgi:hypothetical protein
MVAPVWKILDTTLYVNNYMFLIIYARVTKHKKYKIFKFCNFSIHDKKNSLRMMYKHQNIQQCYKKQIIVNICILCWLKYGTQEVCYYGKQKTFTMYNFDSCGLLKWWCTLDCSYKFALLFKGSNLRTSEHLKFPSFGSRCSPQLQTTGVLQEPEHKVKFQ